MLFGILGVNYFKGAFASCNFTEDLDVEVDTKSDCILYGGYWQPAESSFDNIGYAMLTLFEMSTTEGWVAVMWAGVDA
jgi:hypothetical protein